MPCRQINTHKGFDIESHKPLFDSFFPYSRERLGYTKPFSLNFLSDQENHKLPLGKTAHYNPNTYEIGVYTDGRHIKDILRSVSHELVHHTQNCRGAFNKEFTTGLGYAQEDGDLREMEKEAYLEGNMLFRDWEDNYKQGTNIIQEIKKMTGKEELIKLIKEELNKTIKEERQYNFNVKKLDQVMLRTMADPPRRLGRYKKCEPPGYGYVGLKRNCMGKNVAELQALINQWFEQNEETEKLLRIDGLYGKQTAAALGYIYNTAVDPDGPLRRNTYNVAVDRIVAKNTNIGQAVAAVRQFTSPKTMVARHAAEATKGIDAAMGITEPTPPSVPARKPGRPSSSPAIRKCMEDCNERVGGDTRRLSSERLVACEAECTATAVTLPPPPPGVGQPADKGRPRITPPLAPGHGSTVPIFDFRFESKTYKNLRQMIIQELKRQKK